MCKHDFSSGLRVRISHDYPVFKYEIKLVKRKWGPKRQLVKVLSHYGNYVQNGGIVIYGKEGVVVMNPRTKALVDRAIDSGNTEFWLSALSTAFGMKVTAEDWAHCFFS